MKKILVGVVKASTSKSFWKIALISFGTFFFSWLVMFLQDEKSAGLFGSYTWLVPAILSFAVLAKEFFSAIKK